MSSARLLKPLLAQVGDVRSDHNYPACYSSGATRTRASVCSKFGGLGLFTKVCSTTPIADCICYCTQGDVTAYISTS